jgi:hypothetical protein
MLFTRELAEHALAHVIGDKAEQAFRRSDALRTTTCSRSSSRREPLAGVIRLRVDENHEHFEI